LAKEKRRARGDLCGCISYFCIAVTKIPERTTSSRKDLFQLTVSEGSVHVAWPHALWQNIMVAGVLVKALQYMMPGKEEEDKEEREREKERESEREKEKLGTSGSCL
jgi:hypothetical protein